MNQIAKDTYFAGRRSLSQEVAALIKKLIADGELDPGDRIVEVQLAKDLGISQTPVREAIRQLAGEGIVSIVPNKGPMVRVLNIKDAFEIYSMRALIEGFAIRLATQLARPEDVKELEDYYCSMSRMDSIDALLYGSEHIHQSIVELSTHSRLISSYKSISFQITLLNRILGRRATKEREIHEHSELIEALVKRDPDEAERIARAHVHRAYREFLDLGEVTDSGKEGNIRF